MSDHVISGLIRRRRELSGTLFDLRAQADALAADIAALDHALHLFDPTISLEGIPALRFRPQRDWAVRGAVVRGILSALREAATPLSARELAKAFYGDEPTALHLKRVRKCLGRQKRRGALQSVQVNGQLAWTLAHQP